MKLTPEEIKQRNAARRVRATPITDPEELARITARAKAARLRDDGTTMVVEDALDGVAQGAKRGRNLLNVVAQLITHLTREQQLGLARRLPDLLSREAVEVLPPLVAARLSQPVNETAHPTNGQQQENPFDWSPKPEGS